MSAKSLTFAILLWLLHSVSVRAAESEPYTTDKVYRDYMESYQKAADAYDKSRREGYVSYAILGGFLIVLFALARRTQRAYSEKSLQISLANQKLLEEIRDLLKKDRT